MREARGDDSGTLSGPGPGGNPDGAGVTVVTATTRAPEPRVDDARFYADNPYPAYAWLRREAPVFWYEPAGFWVLSKYDDIRSVSARPELFSAIYGLSIAHQNLANVLPRPLPADEEAKISRDMPRLAELRHLVQFRPVPSPGADSLNNSDPPRHTQVRAILHKAFTPRVITRLEPRIRELAEEAFDAIEPGAVTDFVESVSLFVSISVIAELLGVPSSDRETFTRWARAIMLSAEAYDEADQAYVQDQLAQMYAWLREHVEDHRRNPRDDLITRMIDAEIDGERLTPDSVVSMTRALVGGGADTMVNFIGGAAKVLAEYPDQREILVKRPELIGSAVDELMRWVTPVIAFCRTAMADTEIRGQRVKRGDYVVMLYASANRDEDVWERADHLDVTRAADPLHLAFGYAEHNCLGQSLARMQGRVVLEGLLRRFPRYELAGKIARRPSVLINSIDRMPVRFS
jgi:cytochrome P450